MIDAKLEAAKNNTRVAAYKALVAGDAVELDDETRKHLEAVTNAQVKKRGKITKPTALLVDKSGSMTEAIELGKRIAAMISGVCEGGLHVFAFDTMPYEVKAKGSELSDWDKAFKGINAGGGTACGAPLELMRTRKVTTEQVILVTDEGDNTAPMFGQAYDAYVKGMNVAPNVVIVRVGAATEGVQRQLKGKAQVDTFTFAGDYYSLPNLVPMLARPSRIELLMEIMNTPLPERVK
jgi:hypothetical protein